MSRPKRYFGIITDLSGTLGQGLIANNYSKTVDVSTAEALDEQGKKLDIKGVTQSTNYSIDGLYVGTGIAAGSKLTIDGEDVLVTQNQITQTNADFVKSSLTAVGGDEGTVIWPLSATVSPQP